MPLLYPSIIFQVPCLLLVALLPRVQEILWQKFGRHRSHLLLHSSRGECEMKGGFFFLSFSISVVQFLISAQLTVIEIGP